MSSAAALLSTGKPAAITSGLAAVTIGATNHALGDLLGNCLQRVATSGQLRDILAFLGGIQMIELQYGGIAFAAVNTRVGGQVLPDELPRFLASPLAVAVNVGPILLFALVGDAPGLCSQEE